MLNEFTHEELLQNSRLTLQEATKALNSETAQTTAKISYIDENTGCPRAVIIDLPYSLKQEINMFVALSIAESGIKD